METEKHKQEALPNSNKGLERKLLGVCNICVRICIIHGSIFIYYIHILYILDMVDSNRCLICVMS